MFIGIFQQHNDEIKAFVDKDYTALTHLCKETSLNGITILSKHTQILWKPMQCHGRNSVVTLRPFYQ